MKNIRSLCSIIVVASIFLCAGGKKPEKPKYEDEWIKVRVVRQLYWDSRVDASDVRVEVEEGRVILSGTVPTYFSKLEAFDDAWDVPGVRFVENQLQVQYIPPVPKDEQIRERAERMLEWQMNEDVDDIRVSVTAGHLTLEGTVDEHWKKDRVEELLVNLRGVKLLTNEIAVVPTNRILDKVIADTVTDALERNIYLDVDTIDVKVKNGVVSLSGIVGNRVARREAYEVAVNTLGVIGVHNNLLVRD